MACGQSSNIVKKKNCLIWQISTEAINSTIWRFCSLQKGASEEEINVLPKYKFRCEGFTKTGGDLVVPSNGVMMIVSTASGGAIVERALSAEDAVRHHSLDLLFVEILNNVIGN